MLPRSRVEADIALHDFCLQPASACQGIADRFHVVQDDVNISRRPDVKEFRFVVGRFGDSQSTPWKLWVQGDEAYLMLRNAAMGYQKFSFHSSENCRWARIDPNPSGFQRALLEWARGSVPSADSGQACLLVSVNFPTNRLSASALPGANLNKLHWIEPAPPGWAVHAEIFLTRESRSVIESLLSLGQKRRLLAYLSLRSGMSVCLATSILDCEAVNLRISKSQ